MLRNKQVARDHQRWLRCRSPEQQCRPLNFRSSGPRVWVHMSLISAPASRSASVFSAPVPPSSSTFSAASSDSGSTWSSSIEGNSAREWN